MKFRDHFLTRLIDWETVSWSKSFRGNVPRLRKTEAVLTDVGRSRSSGGIRIQVVIGEYRLNTVLLLTDRRAQAYMKNWFQERRGRMLGELMDEEVTWEPGAGERLLDDDSVEHFSE